MSLAAPMPRCCTACCRATAIAQNHLKQPDSGRVRVELRHPWSDGTAHLDFTPDDLIGRPDELELSAP